MKTRYILFAFAILLASACAKDAAQPSLSERQITLTAWHADSQGTRTSLIDGGTKVYWQPGDAIKVFSSEEANRFESECTSLTDVTTFVGSLNIIGGANEGAEYDNHIWGLYPYRLDATCDGESVTTTLPSNQNGVAGTFAQNTLVTIAHSDNFGLAFYNVCGGIRFSLTKSGIKRVVLESLGGEAIAGTFKTTLDGKVPVVQEVSEPATSITLKAPGDAFEPGEWYYIVALPGTLSSGFKLTFRSGEGVGTLTCAKPVTIRRGIFGSLADVDSGVEFSAGGDDPEAINIEIDGEFWDWAAVPGGLSGSGNYMEFKAAADANYIYLYSKRKWNDQLWSNSSPGYYYYEFDTDNNPATGTNDINGNTGFGIEYWMYLYLFTGTSAEPTFSNTPTGGAYPSPSASVLANILASGATDRTVVEVEVRIPRANLGLTNPGTIRIYSWGNKSAGNLKSSTSYISLTLN